MNQESSKKGKWHTLQVWLLVGVVVGLPAISFIVNLYGSKTGRTFYSGLKNNYGQLGSFNTVGWNNDTISSNVTKGKVLVISFTTDTNRDDVINTLKPIVKTEQFREEIDNLAFITFDLGKDSAYYKSMIQQMNNRDKELWHIAKGGNDLMTQMKIPNSNTISLVDTAGVIRRLYDVKNPEDRKLLVEHIAVMPIKNKKDVVKKDQKTL